MNSGERDSFYGEFAAYRGCDVSRRIHDRRLNRVTFHTRKNTFSRSHTEVCDYAKRNRQSFSRNHVQLDTVAEHSSKIPPELYRSLRLPNYSGMTILHASTSLGKLSIVWHEIHGSLLVTVANHKLVILRRTQYGRKHSDRTLREK